MMGMSFFYFETARAGRLPADTRAPWRGDSLKKTDGGSLDGVHEGGYFDSGDHVKFMLPQAYAMAQLALMTVSQRNVLRYTGFDVRPLELRPVHSPRSRYCRNVWKPRFVLEQSAKQHHQSLHAFIGVCYLLLSMQRNTSFIGLKQGAAQHGAIWGYLTNKGRVFVTFSSETASDIIHG